MVSISLCVVVYYEHMNGLIFYLESFLREQLEYDSYFFAKIILRIVKSVI